MEECPRPPGVTSTHGLLGSIRKAHKKNAAVVVVAVAVAAVVVHSDPGDQGSFKEWCSFFYKK